MYQTIVVSVMIYKVTAPCNARQDVVSLQISNFNNIQLFFFLSKCFSLTNMVLEWSWMSLNCHFINVQEASMYYTVCWTEWEKIMGTRIHLYHTHIVGVQWAWLDRRRSSLTGIWYDAVIWQWNNRTRTTKLKWKPTHALFISRAIIMIAYGWHFSQNSFVAKDIQKWVDNNRVWIDSRYMCEIANLQAHNTSHCKALWACRLSI